MLKLITKKEISEHIDKVEFNLLLFTVSIWIVKNGDASFLIDTGIGSMGKYAIQKYLKKGYGELKAIFLTHGHSDHSSGIKKIIEMSNYKNIPIIVEEKEIQFLIGESCYPERKKKESVLYDSEIFTSLLDCNAEKMLRNAGLKVLFAPGHSPGHTCFFHEKDGVLIGGDLFTTSRQGDLRPPMKQFTADMKLALRTGYEILLEYPDVVLSVSHGTEVYSPLKKFEQSNLESEAK